MCVRPWTMMAAIPKATAHLHGAVYGSRPIFQFLIPGWRGAFLDRVVWVMQSRKRTETAVTLPAPRRGSVSLHFVRTFLYEGLDLLYGRPDLTKSAFRLCFDR